MSTIAIKMKNYAGQVGALSHNHPKRVLFFLLGSLGFLALLYILIIGNMVFNIVERKGLEAQARTLANDVANLELEYLALSSKVDIEFSHSLGFKEVKATFATRKALGSLSPTQIAKNEI